jgi:uroporphyrinogen decarboxylase
MDRVLRCEPRAGRRPFLPAIYEHKAWFIGRTPAEIARDADLLARALLAEHTAVGADALTVGVDVYNIEAEALGCAMYYPPADDPGVPSLLTDRHQLEIGDDVTDAPVPDPRTAGRMPMFVEAARRVRHELGDSIWLRGAVSGPFSLAVSLAGLENLFMACIDRPEWVQTVLAYTGRVVRAYAGAFVDAGVDVVVFDSQATPDLLSPAMYEEFVLPATRDLVGAIRAHSGRDVPLAIGGNTTAIAPLLVRTGANNLLCDFAADFAVWAAVGRGACRSVRRNISPRFIATAAPEAIHATARDEAARGGDLPGFILGTGVIAYGTPTEKLHAIRQACLEE